MRKRKIITFFSGILIALILGFYFMTKVSGDFYPVIFMVLCSVSFAGAFIFGVNYYSENLFKWKDEWRVTKSSKIENTKEVDITYRVERRYCDLLLNEEYWRGLVDTSSKDNALEILENLKKGIPLNENYIVKPVKENSDEI